MRKVYTVFEIVLSLMLIALGIFIFDSGYSGSPRDSMFALPIGAVLLASGFLVLGYAIRSEVWHRRMLRERPFTHAAAQPATFQSNSVIFHVVPQAVETDSTETKVEAVSA